MHHLNHSHKPTQRYQANHIAVCVWLRHNTIAVLFAVNAFEPELLQPWDENVFLTFQWPCVFYYLFVLFLVWLGLCYWPWALSSCSGWRLLVIAVHGLLTVAAPLGAERGLSLHRLQ